MERVTFTDDRGRMYLIEVEDFTPPDEYAQYPVLGPPDVVDRLDLPDPVKTALHNELFKRGIFTYEQARRQGALEAALKAALKIDQQTLLLAYHDEYS